MATQIFMDFLKYLTTHYPNYNVSLLLMDLVSHSIITAADKAAIDQADATSKAFTLFGMIMPLKGTERHQMLVTVLKNHSEDLAKYLDQSLERALQTASSTIAQFDQKTLLNRNSNNNQLAITVKAHNAASAMHTIEAYQKELEANGITEADLKPLIDDVSAVNVPIIIKEMTSQPCDMGEKMNKYYENYSRPKKLPKGLALLINNHTYGSSNHNRTGSQIDFENMRNILGQLEYDVREFTDRSGDEMSQDLDQFLSVFARVEKERCKSCLVAIMAHGDVNENGEHQFLGVDWKPLDEKMVLEKVMNFETLAGIPKIFIFQTCRGSEYNLGQHVPDGIGHSKPSFAPKVPIGADACILHSTTPGYFSWRNRDVGSIFIQAVCRELADQAHKPWADLMTLATRVIDRVGSSEIKARKGKKDIRVFQLPSILSTMRQKFHFFPGYQSD